MRKPSLTNKPSRPVTEKKPAKEKKAPKPASSPEAEEKQLTALAVNLAKKQLIDGTASPSIIAHFLKIASSREVIEREILARQSKLMEAKTSSIAKDKESESIAKEAIEAMKSYSKGI